MTILTVKHLTAYAYASLVQLGEHRLMLRPRIQQRSAAP